MNMDPIEKEELWRSLPVYFFCFLIIGFLDMQGYISIGASGTFILALILTFIHFSLMVWYRKKEQIDNPSIFFIIDYIFRSENQNGKTLEISKKEKISIFSSIRKHIHLLFITIFLYLTYLYASLAYNIDQIFWVLILLFIGLTLSKIVYDEREANRKDPMKLLVFYVIACVFIFVRYLVLGYPIFPILKGSIILGILLVFLVFGIKWSQRKQN